jgi:biofilm PGA synthesis N-glycosyltransferase PgaC
MCAAGEGVYPIRASIGLMAYNEAANIGKVLEALSEQKTLVVSSGSTDGTDEIVRQWEAKEPRIRLIRQERRDGKASAINLFLREARNEVLVLESADTLPLPDTVELLLRPLANESVGMTGARPVPTNSKKNFLGAVVHLMWELHHRLALESPKLGEMVAFKRVIGSIPRESAVDEASFEAATREEGLELVYVPEAIVRNKGPETIRDFLLQRRRIHAGHLWLQETSNYRVSTTRVTRILRHLLGATSWLGKGPLVTAGAVLLEGLGRGLGWFDFRVLNRNPFVWRMAQSTKNLTRGTEAGAA